jgi:hypothetical protein
MPYSIDAERSVLGAILLDNGALPRARGFIRDPGDFYRDPHRRIFGAMGILAERGTATDLVTLTEELTRSGELDEVGGPAFVASLLDGVPHSSNVEHYARIVGEKAIHRRLIELGNNMIEAAFDGNGAVPGAMRKVMEQIREAEEAFAPAVELPDFAALLDAPETPPKTCIEGLSEFGAASLTSGPPGAWKTTIAAAKGLCVAGGHPFAGRLETQQAPVLHVDGEMGETRLVSLYRRLARGEGIDSADLVRRGLLHYLPATGAGPGRDPRTWERLVRERSIGLVILDSAVALYAGDENSSTEVRAWWERSVRPLLDLGAAVEVLHHDRKGSAMIPDSPMTSTRGSGDWRGAPDVHAVVRCEAGDHHLVRVEVTKSRLDSEPAPFCLRVEKGWGLLRVRWAGEARDTVGKTVEASTAIEAMLEAAGPEGMLRRAVLESLKDKYAVRTIEDALSLVKSHAGVTQTREGMQVRYRKARA